MTIATRAATELFHLVFLRALVAKGEDKARIALKGGCNLRFFFGSIRYSEHIDFDVVVIRRDTLKKKVDALLQSPIVLVPLKARGIEIVETSAPKQTDTTQRWKVGLRVQGSDVPIRTKIEFSRRSGTLEGAVFGATDREVLRPFGLTPILATHYAPHAAMAQKIHALARRAEPQARDVFDLHHLLARSDAEQLALSASQKEWLADAIDNAASISYDEYASKVVAFLDAEQANLFASRAAWDAMQEGLIASLEALR
ncbi:MAG: nucleotidyl transferase AbiEii/AbiGii toxin family protein [Polyangiaceae bacterium]|nr:nucleotidyl transferase AbiEii/AbiGii toxin family protein [Polyangiaceae bacterium]